MIPQAYIDEWRQTVPWQEDEMVEQDLLISRTIITVFSEDFLRDKLAFRGGTALYKLYSNEAPRYSEDLDLVQKFPEPIKPICDRIRKAMSWLDEKPSFKQKGNMFSFYFRFKPEGVINTYRKIKIEINCRERSTFFTHKSIPYEIACSYFKGKAEVSSYELEELLALKIRALYQRKKGRDLFDLWYALEYSNIKQKKIFEALLFYLPGVSKKMLIQNVEKKIQNPSFLEDITPLIRPSIAYEPKQAWQLVKSVFEKNMP